VGGPTCGIKETGGLFNKWTPTDHYGVGLTRGRLDLGCWYPIQLLAKRASGSAAAGAPELAARGGGVTSVGHKCVPGHGFAWESTYM
jgi:hypothetical protein